MLVIRLILYSRHVLGRDSCTMIEKKLYCSRIVIVIESMHAFALRERTSDEYFYYKDIRYTLQEKRRKKN